MDIHATARPGLDQATVRRSDFVAYLRTFPGGEVERNRSPSREIALWVG
jgi:hypothetical protein